MRTERKILFHGQYFADFYLEQTARVQEKIEYVFKLLRTVEQVPKKFLKHIEGTDGLFEIRIEMDSNIYRIFCCFDKGNIIILFNAFQKKSQKTPRQELALAQKLMKEYFNQKENTDEKGRNKKR
ncbi:type II toxin-antitoxin system RelE/ParE family toxin [Botryobacter ruber]|uniref:type II toxin-antitoxin system RelE/ParE family toxin n=1 Tax=Botryobacter ruber TaxID=2171629 RepID=UPI000E09FE9F|nr:type II toxin-antitoxin system RelE/ParE family toxin [Botryobacter ruber]